ncbi:Hsp70 family protein [Williamsia muralis]|uniref:Hsp70 family protein n=1 Tax=Williamsia marianensis TaxID=85044 RepID=UPI000DE7238C|nr:Hsp70 family protein [Williamsia marianensis]PVY31377.1 Hsp70 protein [Williamsia marianensis]
MNTSLGLSAGSGMVHCVLLTTDESGRVDALGRVIDVDPTDGLTRAGRINSGIDLMLTQARERGDRVGTIGVAYRTDEHAREIASKGTGAKRQIQLVAETEAVAHQLISTGEISRFAQVVVVDLGDTGMGMYCLDPSSRRITDYQRSESVAGIALDSLIADDVVGSGRLRGRRKSTVLSACRTAKEELSIKDSTALMVGNRADPVTVTRTSLERLTTPMAEHAARVVGDYVNGPHASGAEAVVLVGGIANIPIFRDLIVDAAGLEAVLPKAPESVAATGAAKIAARGRGGADLAFIGGRRSRDWLSAAPLAVFGALLAGALMTVYAVGSSLAGNPSTPESQPPTSSTTTTTVAPTTTVEISSPRVSTPDRPPVQPQPVTITTTVDPAPPAVGGGGGGGGGNSDPGWATTELPAGTGPSRPSTSTLSPSLWPFPLPSFPWTPTLVPPTSNPSTPPPGSTAIEPPPAMTPPAMTPPAMTPIAPTTIPDTIAPIPQAR